MYKIFLTKKAERQLTRLAAIDAERLLEKIPLLASPFSSNLDTKKLVNASNFYRLRIGKVRIIFEILENEKEVWIRKIGYRGGIYR